MLYAEKDSCILNPPDHKTIIHSIIFCFVASPNNIPHIWQKEFNSIISLENLYSNLLVLGFILTILILFFYSQAIVQLFVLYL